MCALLLDAFNECSSSVKEINRLVWKGMSNIYYWEKLRFSQKENLKKWTNFKEQKGIFGGTFILTLWSSVVSRLQNRVSDFF